MDPQCLSTLVVVDGLLYNYLTISYRNLNHQGDYKETKKSYLLKLMMVKGERYRWDHMLDGPRCFDKCRATLDSTCDDSQEL